MDHKQFQDWLSGIDHLSPAQRQEAETVFMGKLHNHLLSMAYP